MSECKWREILHDVRLKKIVRQLRGNDWTHIAKNFKTWTFCFNYYYIKSMYWMCLLNVVVTFLRKHNPSPSSIYIDGRRLPCLVVTTFLTLHFFDRFTKWQIKIFNILQNRCMMNWIWKASTVHFCQASTRTFQHHSVRRTSRSN